MTAGPAAASRSAECPPSLRARSARVTGEHPDPVTGKPVADTTVYDYDATAHGGEHYRVTFRRENTIVQARMIESVERTGGDADPQTVTAPGLWELMYFGKTTA